MLFSIIVPVYNSQEYLENCIDSLINQLYSNIEIILVDDGSIDNSLAICYRYSKQDARVKVVVKSNGGQASARNLGLKHCTGDYVLFVDSDDAISDDVLALNYPILQQGAVDCLQFPLVLNYTFEKEERITCKPLENYSLLTKTAIIDNWLGQCTISWIVCNKIIKRELAVGILFVENMVYEDNNFMINLIDLMQNITLSNQGFYYYYKRLNSTTTSTLTLKKEIDTIFVLENLLSTFEKKIEPEVYVMYLLRMINIEKSIKKNFNKSVKKSKKYISLISSKYIILDTTLVFKDKIKLLIEKIDFT